jgi:hypothetical protein
MKFNLVGIAFFFSFFSSTSFSTEYIYRNLMANTLPSVKCDSPNKAKKIAEKPYKLKRYAKKFCQTQGYGWGVEKVTNSGEITCNKCADDKDLHKCHLKDVVVTCKRIKPGSVGMLPGKG